MEGVRLRDELHQGDVRFRLLTIRGTPLHDQFDSHAGAFELGRHGERRWAKQAEEITMPEGSSSQPLFLPN